MNTFANAVNNQLTTTTNGMVARVGTASACVDLFYKAGAMRGQDIIPPFVAAYVENKDIALRIALWLRDVRGGAGERQLFRDILKYLEKNDPDSCLDLLIKIPELGRFDDLFAVESTTMRNAAMLIFKIHLQKGNGLAFKYAPREHSANHKDYIDLRNFLKMTPKEYRKFIVAGSHTTEQYMCSNRWTEIDFSKIPSLCHARNKKAFYKHVPNEYAEYAKKLDAGTAKINAGAVFPYDVLRGKIFADNELGELTETELKIIEHQWNALPNYMEDCAILPLVDVSGSMVCRVNGGKSDLTCLEIAVSLGLYVADKNPGKFKDMFLTFSKHPKLMSLHGNINQKIDQMVNAEWGMNTNLEFALELILKTAVLGNVPEVEMPKMLLILSDMQFDMAIRPNQSALEMMKLKYQENGYEFPQIVFWNLKAYDNVPAKFNEFGVALISGFSPAILKSILGNNMEDITPENIMLTTVMQERYNYS